MATNELVSAWSADGDPGKTFGQRVGVLLVHGFTGSPAAMSPWARSLNGRGFSVSVPRLPGHGTTWSDMNKTTWADWYGEVNHSFDALARTTDRVAVFGLSMGGALTLRLAADRPGDIFALSLVNPAVNSLRKDALLLPALKWVIPAFPGISNDIKKQGQDEVAYSKTPLKAADSMFKAWAELRPDLHQVVAPTIYFRSTIDHVVDESSEAIIRGALGGPMTFRELPDSYHVATLDNDAPLIFHESAEFLLAHMSN